MKKLSLHKKIQIDSHYTTDISSVVMLRIADISMNPYQPRKQFDEVEIVTLADSIRQHGLLQPITVRYADEPETHSEPYVVVAGERRLRAMKMLSYVEVPCLILDISPREAAELAIIENIMRKDLSMFELAEALQLLLIDYGLTQDELAKRLSTSQSNIANKIRLLRFSDKERLLLTEFALTERHARALIRISDETMRFKAIVRVGEQRLSVKDTESYVESLLLPNEKKKSKKYITTCEDAVTYIRSVLEKPFASFLKRGIQVISNEYEDEEGIRIEIKIPKQG